MSTINLTQHQASPEQAAQGVVDVSNREELTRLLTFASLPSCRDVLVRAELIARMVPVGTTSAMIGGAPYLMSALEAALSVRGIETLYAFSVRESTEAAQPDGTVRKVAGFRHLGFVEAVDGLTASEYETEGGTLMDELTPRPCQCGSGYAHPGISGPAGGCTAGDPCCG